MKNKNMYAINRKVQVVIFCSAILLFAQLICVGALSARGPSCILTIKPELLQTSVADAFLGQDPDAEVKLLDVDIEFTDEGLLCTATRQIRFFPDLSFSALIEVSSPGSNQVELLITETRLIGIKLKSLTGIVMAYISSKIKKGGLENYVVVTEKGLKKDSRGLNYYILLKLIPGNIVKVVDNPVMRHISLNSKGLILTVDANR